MQLGYISTEINLFYFCCELKSFMFVNFLIIQDNIVLCASFMKNYFDISYSLLNVNALFVHPPIHFLRFLSPRGLLMINKDKELSIPLTQLVKCLKTLKKSLSSLNQHISFFLLLLYRSYRQGTYAFAHFMHSFLQLVTQVFIEKKTVP